MKPGPVVICDEACCAQPVGRIGDQRACRAVAGARRLVADLLAAQGHHLPDKNGQGCKGRPHRKVERPGHTAFPHTAHVLRAAVSRLQQSAHLLIGMRFIGACNPGRPGHSDRVIIARASPGRSGRPAITAQQMQDFGQAKTGAGVDRVQAAIPAIPSRQSCHAQGSVRCRSRAGSNAGNHLRPVILVKQRRIKAR